MGKDGLKLVIDRKTKPRRTYAGDPLECKPCKNRNLVETFSPTYKNGRTIKGKRTGWACPYCQKVISE